MASGKPTARGSGIWQVRPLRHEGNADFYQFIPLVVIIFASVILLFPLWQPGYPWGSDSWGHLQRAAHMADSIRSQGLFEGFLHSAWMPDWYMGDPTRVYYPPLTTWLMGLLTGLTGDVFIAYRIFVSGIILTLGLSTYWIGNEWGRNRLAALVGGVLVMTAPYTLRTIFVEGNFPRGLALLPLPWIILLSERLLTSEHTRRYLILMALLWCFTILAHVMQALIFAVVIGAFIVVRVLINEYVPIRRALLGIAAIAFGGGLSAFYLLPAYSKLELGNVPYLPDAKIDLFSISLPAFNPQPVNIEAISIGIAIIIVATFIALRTQAQHQRALVLVSALAILAAFGEGGILFIMLPLNQSLLPERFLNASAVLLPLAIASSPMHGLRLRWIIAAGIIILAVDFAPVWRVIHMRPMPPDIVTLAQQLSQQPESGRFVPLVLPSPNSAQIYLLSTIGERKSVSGWALENTPHHQEIRRLIAAAERAPDYLTATLSLWNVDFLLSLRDTLPELAQTPYEPIKSDGDFTLYVRESPTAFAQIVPDDRMLVIGDNPTAWLFAFPFASEGYSSAVTDYNEDYLKHFSTIGITRVSDPNNLENQLGDWVRAGHTLIVDMSGLPEPYNVGFNLFGVQTFSLGLTENASIQSMIPDLEIPANFTIPDDMPMWVGNTYRGLDEEIITLTHKGETYPLLGYKDVGAGRVWFVGFNYFYWFDLHNQIAEARPVINNLLADNRINRDLTLPPLPSTTLEHGMDRIELTYEIEEPVFAVLSETYFPRWQAELDGFPITIQDHQHLMGFDLPAGNHTLTLTYQPYSVVSAIGLLGTAITAGIGLLILYRYVQNPLTMRDRLALFYDRHNYPTGPEVPQTAGPICPNCGKSTTIVGPPTANTFPFLSITCTACGYSTSAISDDVQGESPDWLQELK